MPSSSFSTSLRSVCTAMLRDPFSASHGSPSSNPSGITRRTAGSTRVNGIARLIASPGYRQGRDDPERSAGAEPSDNASDHGCNPRAIGGVCIIAAPRPKKHEMETPLMSEPFPLPTKPEDVIPSLVERFNSRNLEAMMELY